MTTQNSPAPPGSYPLDAHDLPGIGRRGADGAASRVDERCGGRRETVVPLALTHTAAAAFLVVVHSHRAGVTVFLFPYSAAADGRFFFGRPVMRGR